MEQIGSSSPFTAVNGELGTKEVMLCAVGYSRVLVTATPPNWNNTKAVKLVNGHVLLLLVIEFSVFPQQLPTPSQNVGACVVFR